MTNQTYSVTTAVEIDERIPTRLQLDRTDVSDILTAIQGVRGN
jgi:hypothetical protein